MSEYYGVSPSSDFFMHYGVKGMKWGVRRALEKGDEKALSKQYKKALAKAKKLNTNADISRSTAEAVGRLKDGAGLIGSGVAIAGGSLGLREFARANNIRGLAVGHVGLIPVAYDTETGPKVAVPIGGALGALGAYDIGKSIAAKRRTTKKGHAKAQAKAKQFRNEMAEVFKGTKYSKLPGANEINKPYGYVEPSNPLYKPPKNQMNSQNHKKKRK